MTVKQPSGSRQTLLVLKTLRVSLHVMFAFLLVFGAVLALLDSVYEPRHALIGALALALGGTYLWGTVYENHRGLPIDFADIFFRPGRQASYRRPSAFTPAHLWLLLITLLWAGLMCLDSAFTWVVFPVMFLYLHLLKPRYSVLATCTLCLAAIALPLLGPAGFGWAHLAQAGIGPGYIIGPTLGALVATVISFTYRALRQDAAHQFHLAEQLRAVQAELAQEQYSAGKLAERERLAREIHDTLTQGLSSIVLISRAAQASLQAGAPDAAAEQVRVIQESAAANLAEARRFIRDLSSPALDNSLVGALGALADSTEAAARAAGAKLTCSFMIEGNEAEANALPEPVSSALLRVAQGALANVAAHSQATQAALTLTIWPDQITLDVFDNGRGFTVPHLAVPQLKQPQETGGAASSPLPALTDSGTGFGLPSLLARIEALGGSLHLESGPQGTTLTAHLPKEGPA